MLTWVVELVSYVGQHRDPADASVCLLSKESLGKFANLKESCNESFVQNADYIAARKVIRLHFFRGCTLLEDRAVCCYPDSGSIAMGVGQHRQVIKQSQNSSAVAKLRRKQQQTLPQLLQRDIGIRLPGEKSTNQLGAITGRPDLGKQTSKKRSHQVKLTVFPKCLFILF